MRVKEVPATFHERVAGESKLDAQVMMQFGALLLDKTFAGYVPLRFLSFAVVGGIGVMVHLSILALLRESTGLGFGMEQSIATVVAMVCNFELNNVITYADQRLKGPRLWRGLLLFMLVCGVGAIANIGIARTLYASHTAWSLAGAMGAVIGVVWNYAVSATLVWRHR
jgi:dolichol-phosphate mannosyltransferase